MPANIPDGLEVDVSALNIGDSIHLKDVQLPPGIKVLEDADLTIATVLSPTIEKEVVEEIPAEEGEEEKVAAEAEGAEEKKAEEKKEGEGAKEGKEKKD